MQENKFVSNLQKLECTKDKENNIVLASSFYWSQLLFSFVCVVCMEFIYQMRKY